MRQHPTGTPSWEEKYYAVVGELGGLPNEFKKWKTLDEYRRDWSFLSYGLRERVAEQVMACHYLASLEDWLEPKITLQKNHRMVLVQSIASIYEGVLGWAIYTHLTKGIMSNGRASIFIKGVVERCRFEELIRQALEFGVINVSHKKYLDKLREARNYIHLNKTQAADTVAFWVTRQTGADILFELENFRINFIF